MITATAAMTTMMMMPTSSEAAEEVASKKESSMVAGAEVARRLRGVPTFAIVDGNGVPFATYEKGGASGTGYFFTTIAAAQYVLEDAKKAFQEARLAGRDTEDSWGDSHTVTVSLAVALQLSVKKRINIAQNGNSLTTYYQILPGTSELQLAQRLDKNRPASQKEDESLSFIFPSSPCLWKIIITMTLLPLLLLLLLCRSSSTPEICWQSGKNNIPTQPLLPSK